MSVGVGEMLGLAHDPDSLVDEVRRAAADGFARAWFAQIPSRADALTLIAIAGREVDGIELGTAVVPVSPRHPAVLAQQALTVQAAIGGRLVLGVGLSHRALIEGYYGLSYERPVKQMRDYLEVLLPLIRHEPVRSMTMDVPGVKSPPPVMLAALAPRMLALAGAVADGTITWMTGPRGLAEHIVPGIGEAACAAGRPAPEIAVGLPVCVTDDVAGARLRVGQRFEVYGSIPSYRAMLDREGVEGPADVALVGDEAAVTDSIQALADAGATELLAVVYGTPEERDRTRSLLRDGAPAA